MMAQHEEAARFLKMINEAAANNERGERLVESLRKEKGILRSKLDEASAEYESKKNDHHKSQEEYKTLSAQLLSIQAANSVKKARITVLQDELTQLRTRTNQFEDERERYRAAFTSKMQVLNETLRRLHAQNTDAALKEELKEKQDELAVLRTKVKLQDQSDVKKSEEGETAGMKSELTSLELETKETVACTATKEETLKVTRAHKAEAIKQLNEVNKQNFEKQKKLEQLQLLGREYEELENLQRESGTVQEAFSAAHADFQKRSACPKCGKNAYAVTEQNVEKLGQEE